MKHIFIGIDGTANAAFYDQFRSNVYRFDLALRHQDEDGNTQFFIYLNGVGVGAFNLLGLAFGRGIDELVLQAYINLVSNYQPGDKIYILGFSRGAVAARALTGLISYSGLLTALNSHHIESAWQHFLGENDGYKNDMFSVTHDPVKIEFIGLWDTVYGRGVQRALTRNSFNRLRLRNFAVDPKVNHAVQLLAIDESRRYFHPIYWDSRLANQTLEQIWLPGVHSDVGGGYASMFFSTLSLLAMIDKAKQCCPRIRFDDDYVRNELLRRLAHEDIVINDEWKGYRGATDWWAARTLTDKLRQINHYVHPVFDHLSAKKIAIRGRPRPYVPQIAVMNDRTKMPLARFDADSLYAKRIESIIEQKVAAL